MSVHGKPILDRIDWLHDVARRYSAAYCDPEACLARELHRARHPTAIAVLKCMDGRINIPIATNTPPGIIQPFRNLGGFFDLGWPHLGEVLAGFVIFGVVACAITSGDTAFRSARLIVADFMGVEQRSLRKRICISVPLFAAGLVIIFCLPFQTMWSYFAWMNQTLAMVTLWMITAFLNRHGRNRWVGLIPATVMTYVCSSYVFVSPLMCGMRDRAAAYLLGGAVTLVLLIILIFKMRRDAKSLP